LVDSCPEGVSSKHSDVSNYRCLPYREIEKLVETGKLANDRVGVAFLALITNVMEKARCILVSGDIDIKVAQQLRFLTAGTPQKALGNAFGLLETQAKVSVFKRAGEIMSIVESREVL